MHTQVIYSLLKLNSPFYKYIDYHTYQPILTISVHLTVIVGSLNFFVSVARLDGISALTRMRRFTL